MPRFAVWVLSFFAANLLGQQYPFVPIPNSPKNIEHIVQDRLGRLWLSTHDDVLCFDGARFFSLRDFGFPPVMSYDLAVDLEGAILSTTNVGVYRFSKGRLEQILSGPRILEIIAVAPGLLLATGSESLPAHTLPNPTGTANRLYRLRMAADRWSWQRLSEWRSTGPLSRDAAGNILTVCPGGWCELSSKLIADWTPGSTDHPVFHPSGLPDLQRVVRDRKGCLWFRTIESGYDQCPGDAAPMRLPAAVAGRNIWAAAENDDGSMLFANVASVALGRPGAFQVATPDQGLPPVSVSSALCTPDGTIWIGSIDGLYRFPHPFRLEQWRSRHGPVWSFARAGERMLAGTSTGVAFLDNRREWSILSGSSTFASISSLVPDAEGNVYAAVSHEGVILLSRDGRLIARTPINQGKGAEVLAKTSDGGIWLAGVGIQRVRRQGRDLLLDPEPLPAGDSAAGMVLDRRTGELWVCSPHGLSRRKNENWESVSEPGSLPNMACSSVAADPDGDLWLGYPTLRTLALAHANVLVQQFAVDPAGGPYFLGVDSRGWLWRGSGDGTYAARLDQARIGVWTKLSERDGLTNVDANRRAFFSDEDGSVWWAADANIVHFWPSPALVDPAGFVPAFLSGFSVDGGAARLADAQTDFPHGKKLTVLLGSLQFNAREAFQIRFRWLPGQKEWRNAQSLDIDLGTPAWGTHFLEFQSRLQTGDWSQSVSRSLTVLRPWWFSWQTVSVLCAAFYVGTAGILRWRRGSQTTGLPDLTDWRIAALSPELHWMGTILDRRYEIESLIAVGGFASVLKGRDQLYGGRPCAIKIFRPEVTDRSWVAHRFQQEVSALERIRHPSVVSIYGHGVTPEATPYLVMEFIEGVTLRDLLNLGPVPAPRAGSLLLQMAGALAEIHPLGIYHRDLKPENLMIRSGSMPGEELVLIDFSIAIVKEPDKTMHGLSRAAGTIYYMAPEQAVGFAGPASDVYSLAKILLEMLTGQRLSTLLPDAAMDLPDRVKELVRTLPVRFSEESIELLGSALEFDPSRRPQDARSFAGPVGRDLLLASNSA